MADNLQILGKTYTNVAGIKAVNSNGDTLTFVKGEGGGGDEGCLIKHTGSFTPASTATHFEVTGLGDPAIIVSIGIHENALDGTPKFVKSIYANGSYADFRTNANGTSLTNNGSSNLGAWCADRTIEADGYVATGGAIVATATGFAASSSNSGTYGFKSGYTYDWVCFTYPVS